MMGRSRSALFVSLAAVGGVVFFLFLMKEPGPVGSELGRIAGGDGRGEGFEVAEPARSATSEGSRTELDEGLSAPVDEDCAFAQAWLSSGVSPESLAGILAGLEAVGPDGVTCLPDDWVATALVLHCAGDLSMTPELVSLLAAEFASRVSSMETFESASAGVELRPEQIPCLIALLQGHLATDAELGSLWAWSLRRAFSERSHIFSAHPDVVEELAALMKDWPLSDVGWWEQLWNGIKQDPTQASAGLRVAIYESLFQVLPKEECLGQLSLLSSFEEFDAGVAGMSLWGMGMTVSRHLPKDDYLALLSNSDAGSPEWSRALVFGIPDEVKWPSEGHSAMPEHAKDALLALRDSPSYPYTAEIVRDQWQILGPSESIADLESFVLGSMSSSDDWGYEASVRIRAAVDAFSEHESRLRGEGQLEHASTLVRDLLVLASPAEAEDILNALRNRGVAPSESVRGKEWRDRLVAVLGDDGVLALGSDDLRDWLQAP